MDKKFKVHITDETGAVVLDDTYTGITMLANVGDGAMAEVILHDNIANIAAKLATGSKCKVAVRMAAMMMDMEKGASENKAENALIREIMRSMEEGE